jgi:hypothetical protein
MYNNVAGFADGENGHPESFIIPEVVMIFKSMASAYVAREFLRIGKYPLSYGPQDCPACPPRRSIIPVVNFLVYLRSFGLPVPTLEVFTRRSLGVLSGTCFAFVTIPMRLGLILVKVLRRFVNSTGSAYHGINIAMHMGIVKGMAKWGI